MSFGQKSTAAEVIEGHDLTGYNVLITGANQGLGLETVRNLAKAGATIYMTARNPAKCADAVQEVIKSSGNSKVYVEELELDSLAKVRAYVKQFLEKNVPIHILINNAGCLVPDLQYTVDGYEYQFAVNHLGHFALTTGLLPALKAGAKDRNVRVVTLSSVAHSFSDMLEDWNFKNTPYNRYISYGQSKTANALFSVGLNDRYSKDGIYGNSVMPGVIMTNIVQNTIKNDSQAMSQVSNPNEKTVPQGAATTVWAAVSKELEGKGGLYLENCQVSKENSDPTAHTIGHLPRIHDKNAADKLWELSEKLVN